MSNELSDKEAQELFAQVSTAIQDADKLNELMSAEPTEEEETTETATSEEPTTEEENTSVETTEETTTEEEETPPAKNELDELREQLQKMQKENHALRSQAGRMPHVQRKIKELDAKLEELNQRAASPSNRPSTAINEKVKAALKGIGDTDPELADAIAEAMKTAISGQEDHMLTRERETLELLRQQEYQAYQAGEVQRLLDMYPNAPEVFASQSWKEWKSQQTERIIALADSDSADDVSFAFKLYADAMLAQNPNLAAQVDKDTGVDEAANKAKAAQIEQERKRKQEKSVVVGSPAAQGKVSLPDDPEALFRKYSEEIRKNISG